MRQIIKKSRVGSTSTARPMGSGRVAGRQGWLRRGCVGHFKSRDHIPFLELGGEYANVRGVSIFSSRPVFG